MAETGHHVRLQDYWHLFVRRRWFLFLPMMIVPLVAVLLTFFMKPTYQSSTSILLGESTVLPPTVERGLSRGVQPSWVERNERVAALTHQILSASSIRSLIAKLEIPVPPDLLEKATRHAALMPDISPAELANNMLIESLRRQIDVRMQGPNLLVISVRSGSPVMARRLTQGLAEIFLEESLAHELAGVQGSISFTEEQVALYRDKLYNAEDKLRAFRQSVISTNVAQDTTALNVNLNSILSAIQGLEADLDSADDERAELRTALIARQIEVNSLALPEEVARLKSNLMAIVPRLGELLSGVSWRDAKVVALNQEAKEVLGRIETLVKSHVAARYSDLPPVYQQDIADFLILSINIEFMQAKRAALDKAVAKIKGQLTRNPDIEINLARLQSEVNRYRDLYNLFVQHSQYAAIDQSAKKVEAQSKYQIVQPAALPLAPISPNRSRIAIFGVILGFALGAGAIFLAELLDDSFRTVEQVEGSLGLPVLATVPRISTPLAPKRKERVAVIAGGVISFLLVVAIIYLKFRTG